MNIIKYKGLEVNGLCTVDIQSIQHASSTIKDNKNHEERGICHVQWKNMGSTVARHIENVEHRTTVSEKSYRRQTDLESVHSLDFTCWAAI